MRSSAFRSKVIESDRDSQHVARTGRKNKADRIEDRILKGPVVPKGPALVNVNLAGLHTKHKKSPTEIKKESVKNKVELLGPHTQYRVC